MTNIKIIAVAFVMMCQNGSTDLFQCFTRNNYPHLLKSAYLVEKQSSLPLLSFTIPITMITDTDISFAAVMTLIILNVTFGKIMIIAMIVTEIEVKILTPYKKVIVGAIP
jgi:hypothetical protein